MANKWENQRINKHFINSKKNIRCVWMHRRKKDELRENQKLNQYYNLNDYHQPIKSNPIPSWVCSKCTYYNIERRLKCTICTFPYSSKSSSSLAPDNQSNYYPSDQMTLGQFCKNEWDSLPIPVWTCSKCTYCNIERLPNCQICSNLYSINKKEETEIYKENYYIFSKNKKKTKIKQKQKKIVDSKWSCTRCTLLNSMNVSKCILCDSQRKSSSKKPESNTIEINKKYKYDIAITIKLNTNCWFYGIKSFKMNNITYYNLSECNLKITSATKTKEYSLFPSTSKYKLLKRNIIIPVNRNTNNKIRYTNNINWNLDNNPLKGIANCLWNSRFNHLNIKPKWNIVKCSNLNEINFYYILISKLILYIPSNDICKVILFEYIGIESMNNVMNNKMDINVGSSFKIYDIIYAKDKRSSSSLQWFKAEIQDIKYCKRKAYQARKIEKIYIHYQGYSSNYDQWCVVTEHSLCSCVDICDNNNHLIKKWKVKKYDAKRPKLIKNYKKNSLNPISNNMHSDGIININGNIILNKNLFNMFNRNDNLFVDQFNNKYPFKLYDTKLNIIRERKHNYFEFIEVGYNKNDMVQIYQKHKEKLNEYNEKHVIDSDKILKLKEYRPHHRSIHFKQNKKKIIKQRSIKRFYPKKYIKLKKKANNK